jgi:hypothetical protein
LREVPGGVFHVLQRRLDGAAGGVTHDHDQPAAEPLGGELDAAHLRGGDDVAGHPDDEQVADALVEHHLCGHARIRAAEHDRERRLPVGQLAPAGVAEQGIQAADVGGETAVAFLQT